MLQKQNNWLNMATTSLLVLDTEPLVVNSIVELGESVSGLRSCVKSIRATATEQVQNIKGVAQEKLLNKTNLAHSAALVAAGLKTFAHKNKMYDLETRVKCKEKSLLKLNDNMLIEKADFILQKVKEHQTALMPYGIVVADTTNLSDYLTIYLEKYNNPTLAIEKRKFYTKKLSVQFSILSDILRNEIDELMIIIANTHPDLYKLYKNARVIIDRHGKTKEDKVVEGIGDISTTVCAAFDGSVIEGVELELIDSKDKVVLTVETDEMGVGYFEKVVAGTYRIRAKQDTYIDKLSEEIIVNPGDELEIDMMLEALIE